MLVNREVDESAAALESIVRAERTRRIRVEDQIRPILAGFEHHEAEAV